MSLDVEKIEAQAIIFNLNPCCRHLIGPDELAYLLECRNKIERDETGIKECREVVETWNKMRLPHWRACRAANGFIPQIKSRLKDKFWREHWREALEIATKAPWLQKKGSWQPNIEWFLRNGQKNTVASLIDGKYQTVIEEPKDPELPKSSDSRTKFKSLFGDAV